MEVNPEDDLNQSIVDHLAKQGYTKAVKALKEELKTKKKPQVKPKKKIDEMMKTFENGDQAKFISFWNE
jgi:hypothetical protein